MYDKNQLDVIRKTKNLQQKVDRQLELLEHKRYPYGHNRDYVSPTGINPYVIEISEI